MHGRITCSLGVNCLQISVSPVTIYVAMCYMLLMDHHFQKLQTSSFTSNAACNGTKTCDKTSTLCFQNQDHANNSNKSDATKDNWLLIP